MYRYRRVVALFLVLAACIFSVAERTFPASGWIWAEATGTIALLWYLCLVYQSQLAVLFTSFFQIFSWLGLLASALAISSGSPMVEIERAGTSNGTFWVILGFCVACTEITIIGYRSGGGAILGRGVLRLPKILQNLTLFVAIGSVLALSAYTVISLGSPVMLGVSRTEFWRDIAPASIAFLPNLTNQTYFFAAFYFLHRRLHASSDSLLLGLLVVLSYAAATIFVLGEKFSAFIVYGNAWLLVLAALYPGFRLKPAYMIVSGLLCASMAAFIAYTYTAAGSSPAFIFTRIALQAQLLWSVIDDGSGLSALPHQWRCFWECNGLEGTQYLSQRYLPAHRFAHYQNVGSRLSGFMPALSLLSFGWIATGVIFAAMSFTLGFLQRKIVAVLPTENVIYGFMLFKLQFGLSSLLATGLLVTFRGVAAMVVGIAVYNVLFHKEAWTAQRAPREAQRNMPAPN
jgi:hypothetical protein